MQIVAEIGQTHQGSLDLALESVRQFAQAGATSVKFQALQPEKIANATAAPYWATTRYAATQRESFQRAGLLPYDRDVWRRLRDEAWGCGVGFIVTPFDLDAVKLLKPLQPDQWKVASGDITNWQLIRSLPDQGRVVLSTGGSTAADIRRAVAWLVKDPLLLACSLVYPTDLVNANLARVDTLRHDFPECGVGYSDHTVEHVSEFGFALGCLGLQMAERHVSLKSPGSEVPDDDMALDPDGFASYVRGIRRGEALRGSPRLSRSQAEKPATLGARRSLYWTRDLPVGHRIESADLTALRPCVGRGVAGAEEVPALLYGTLHHAVRAGDPCRPRQQLDILRDK